MVQVKISSNIYSGIRTIQKLDRSLKTISKEIGNEIAKDVKKGILQRAPKDTGFLKNSVKINYVKRSNNEEQYTVGITGNARRYAILINRGFKPHWIPRQYMELHKSNPGTKGERIDPSEVNRYGGYVWSKPNTKYIGFVDKAFESTERRSKSIVQRAIAKIKL